jgi:hypothetical protein
MRVRTIRWWWLLAAFFSGLAFAMWAEELVLNARDSRVEFSAPRVHFLTGRPLERMRNSDQVPFLIHTTLWSGTRTHLLKETAARFMVSYDLFEEKFSVSEIEPNLKKAGNLMSDVGAEACCLQQMSIDVTGVGGSEQLWARLEIRAQDPKDGGPLFGKDNITDSGISLNSGITKLIDIFSRPAQASQHPLTLEAGPLTLDELRRSAR